MTRFFKYLIYRLGNICFWLGLFLMLGFTGITIYEVVFHVTGTKVEARVDDTETLCVLKWKVTNQFGKSTRHTSDKMDCAEAARIKQTDPMQAYRLIEQKRSYLAYGMPDGATRREWTGMTMHQGRYLKRGDRLVVMVDPEDPSNPRSLRSLADLGIAALVIAGCFVAMLLGWFLKGISQGLPRTFWRRSRPKPRRDLDRELEELHATVRRRRAF